MPSSSAPDAAAPAVRPTEPDPVAAVASLDEPTRRRLYEVVVRSEGAVSRDEAAAQVGIARGTAAFHLDRLAATGLLEVTFERLSGRTGPGAGRPSKLYRRAPAEVAVSLPERRYDLAGRLLAETVDEVEASGEKPRDVLGRHARREGVALGAAGRSLRSVLEGCGYEPRETQGDAEEPDVVLANCPFHDMADDHPDLVCGMNLHLIGGVLEGLGEDHFVARLDPAPGRCCVRLTPRT